MPTFEYEATVEDVSLRVGVVEAVVVNRDQESRVVSQPKITISLASGNAVHERTGDIGVVPQSLVDAAAALRAELDAYLLSLIADGKHTP